MESAWPGLPTQCFLGGSLWNFLGGVFFGGAVCRIFWAVFFSCFFCFFSRKKTRKKQKQNKTKKQKKKGSPEKKGVTPDPGAPGPPVAEPPLTLHWRNLVPVETILCNIQVCVVFWCALFFPRVLLQHFVFFVFIFILFFCFVFIFILLFCFVSIFILFLQFVSFFFKLSFLKFQ